MRINFMSIKIDNIIKKEALSKIKELIENRSNGYVVTVNVDHIVRLHKDEEFRKTYSEAEMILTDGKPLMWFARLYGTPIKEKISGSDLFFDICALAAFNHYSMFLLGAMPGVADRAAKIIREKYGVEVVGTYSPPFGFEKDRDENSKIVTMIKESRPDILVLGLGTPKQEKNIYKMKDDFQVPISFCMGACIDFMAGNIKRAPRWMSANGFEWLYRLYKEPRRLFKRYLIDDMQIIPLVIKYWIKS